MPRASRADAEGERQQDDEREAGRAAHAADGVADVLSEGTPEVVTSHRGLAVGGDVVAARAHGVEVAEAGHREAPGLVT
jgi:hypothetical protein